MAWTNNSAAILTPENPATATVAPLLPTLETKPLFFDASKFAPFLNNDPLEGLTKDAEKTEEEKQQETLSNKALMDVLSNPNESGTARVAAAKFVYEMKWTIQEQAELEERLKALELTTEANTNDSELPPHLRRRN